ncbi:plasmid partitioning protein RepB C-terminal domain-containing protein [Neorhodopirellula pilleata]|uniref:Nucleoid occlusion protein n=1 Tax=Neorhodopirellula pilleata TaxID=2714738 RepID=A0A5C5ZZ93_9BACT|nr:plasmid partitioning protein RepB C-terminal domain-containing protein [Neorhodopirellula pilleata]TWT91643.1 Nucleoid occlusion protein [Neorhodopirellula pilleata]
MTSKVQLACETVVRELSLSEILPMRKIPKNAKGTVKYRQIVASIKQIGLIEPLVVHRQKGSEGQFILLDGNVRYEVMMELKFEKVKCLIALDDEAFTYNHKVNRLTAIQEHFMIMKAVKSGVSESQIADVLDIDVALIRKKRDLLVGICPEAIELLKGKKPTSATFVQMRKVIPMRQIEMAELMCATSNFTDSYSKCLIAATPTEQLVDKECSREVDGLSLIDMARMEREMDSLAKDFKQIDEVHGKNVLNLVIAVGYLKSLLDNARIVRYLAGNYPEILNELQKVSESRMLEVDTDQ